MINLSILILGLLFIWKFDFISKKINLYDFPDKSRKFQKTKISLLGGPFIVLIFNFFIILNYPELINFDKFPNLLLLESYREVFLFFLISNSIFLIGLYDDKYNLSPRDRVILLLILITFFVYFDQDVKIEELRSNILNTTISLKGSSLFFTTSCFFVLIVALNMFDGVNGQSFINFMMIFIYLLSYDLFQKISYLLIFSSNLIDLFKLNTSSLSFTFCSSNLFLKKFSFK